jgi:ABC-type transport system involved in cytochrome c biogenesis permease subunit
MKDSNTLSQTSLRLVLLAVLALAALWLSGMPFFFEEVRLLSGSGRSSGAYRLVTWGNTLIAASAALYMANRYLSVDAVGRWATRLAGAGAAVLVADIGAAPLGLAPELPVVYHAPVLQYHEAISVMVPMAVICYLVVERVNQERAAGAFVMWTILCIIGLEVWLLASSAGNSSALISGFHDYWGQAYLLAHVIGYGAFVVAAGTGILFLARQHLEARGIRHPLVTRWLPDSWGARTVMLSAIGVGVPVFALALFLALVWALGAGMQETFAWFKGLWVAGVLALYGAILHLLVTRIMPGPRMAWVTVLGLALTLAAFLATHVVSHDPAILRTPSGRGSRTSARRV